jgi:hypothetical protein
VACDEAMTEAKVKAYVAWIKEGHQPEEYQASLARKSQAPAKAKDHDFEGIQGSFPVKASTEKGELEPAVAAPSHRDPGSKRVEAEEKPQLASRSFSEGGPTTSPNPVQPASLPAEIAWGVLWTKLKRHVPNSVQKHVFPWFIRYFNFVNGWVQRLGVKNKYWAAIITIFLTFLVGSFLLSHAGRLLTRGVSYLFYSSHSEPQHRQVIVPTGQNEGSLPAVVSPTITSFPVSALTPGNSQSVVGSVAVIVSPTITPLPTTGPISQNKKSDGGSSKTAGTNSKANGGIQYSATIVVPVHGSTVTGAVNSQSISMEGPNVLGVKLPGVSVDNPLGGLFGGSPKTPAPSSQTVAKTGEGGMATPTSSASQ